jgi:hypothetical protein
MWYSEYAYIMLNMNMNEGGKVNEENKAFAMAGIFGSHLFNVVPGDDEAYASLCTNG